MADNASRDENYVPTLIAASSSDGISPVKVYADPTTHRLLTNATSGAIIGPGSSTDNAVVRWSGTAGNTLKNSIVTITDAGVVSAVSLTAMVSGASSVTPGVFVVNSTVASQPALAAQNDTNFAHAGNIILAQMFNSSDSGDVIKISNNGTGFSLLFNNGAATVATFSKDGSWQPPTVADASAADNSVYYSSDATKLVYKDSGGVVHALY